MDKNKKEELADLLKKKCFLINLTSAQKRLLFAQLLDKDNSFYNNFAVFRVEKIEYAYFEKAIESIVSQGVLLRAKVINLAGKYFFCEEKDYKPQIDYRDFTGYSRKELDQTIERNIDEVIPLDKAGLYRIGFYKHEGETYLVFNFHHIILDGWSLGLFFSALTKYYAVFSDHKTLQLEDYVISDNFAKFYGDEKKDQTKFGKKRAAYWKERLEDYSEVEFPLDKMRPKNLSYVGKKKELTIDGTAYTKFVELCKGNRITLFSGLITLFYSLLVKYTGQTDVTIGTVHANRLSTDYEKTIGTFLNTLPIRINFEDQNGGFIECAKKMQRLLLQDQINQIPFDNLVELLNMKRDICKNAIFQILFIFQNMLLSIPTFDGGKTEYLSTYHNDSTRTDLELHIWEKENKFVAYLFYNSELFYDETVNLLLEHFYSLFVEVTEKEYKMKEIQLPPVDIDSVIAQTMSDDYKKCDFCQGLDEVAKNSPDKVAIVFNDQHITYSVFGKLVEHYEKNILTLDFKKGYVIGVYMNRSIEMVAILHAIIRSGCGYIPIERSLPTERILDIITDTQVEYIFHNLNEDDEGLREISPKCNSQFINIHDFKDCSECKTERITENDVAYIIYTSGSTGKTKGVILTRENLRHYLHSYRKLVTIDGTWLAVTNYNFDLSVVELLVTLYYGSRIVLTIGNSRQFLTENNAGKVIKNCLVTHLQMVPTMSRLVFEGARREELDNLKYIMLGGEYSAKTLLELIREKSSAKIINMYGPTETTIFMSYHEISVENENDVLGEVFENVRVKILDENKRPVPKNIPGELHVGGPCVCKGYTNREDLVQEKFSIMDGIRYYQTGDICKINSRNQFILIGRNDRQVKLNGFRIELGEIEADIMLHSEVQACSVLLCGVQNPELVAFISVLNHEERSRCQNEIHLLLKRKLPFYMIPSKYVFLETIPMNVNGKTDVKRLKEYYERNKDLIVRKSMSGADSKKKKRIEDPVQFIHQPSYKEKEKIVVREIKSLEERAILFADKHSEQQELIISKLSKVYKKIIIVRPGDLFKQNSSDEYEVNITNLGDYKLLYEHLEIGKKEDISVFGLWGAGEKQAYDAETYNRNVIHCFYLFKSLIRLMANNAKIGLIGMNGINLHNGATFNYNYSFMQTAILCLLLEGKTKYCAYIDFDEESLHNESALFEAVILDFAERRKKEYLVRKGHYCELSFGWAKMQSGSAAISAEDNQTVILFGGLSGIGLEMAEYLSDKSTMQFVLTSRSVFPDRKEWGSILADTSKQNQRMINSIQKICRIEEKGSRVIMKQADVTRQQDLIVLQSELADAGIQPKGVIYCAAKGNSGYLLGIDEKNVKAVLEAKTTGASNVMKIFGKQIDFAIVCSSLCSKLGGIASYDYCAANAGLDSYTDYLNSSGFRVFDFCWDLWKETGMAYRATQDADAINTDGMLEDGITNSEAYKIFEAMFAMVYNSEKQGGEYDISVYPLNSRYEERFENGAIDPYSVISDEKDYMNLINGKEKTEFSAELLRKMWSIVLGKNDFSDEDNFFDIGGNSILLIRVQSMLDKVLKESIPLNALYNYPTIKGLSDYAELLSRKTEESTEQNDAAPDENAVDRRRLGKRLQKIKNHEEN